MHFLFVHPGGPLVFEVGYHPCKKKMKKMKNHVIRVFFSYFFQDQAMYLLTLFRGAKTCKIGKKGYVMATNFGKDMIDN